MSVQLAPRGQVSGWIRQVVAEALTGPHGEFTLQAEEEGPCVVIAGRAGTPQTESAPMEIARSEIIDALDLTLPRGGRIAGQITVVAGRELVGSKVLTFDRERESTRPTFPQPHAVATDGCFDLGPLPAGKISIYWCGAGRTNFGVDMWGRPMGGEFLGVVDVVENETVHSAFSLAR